MAQRRTDITGNELLPATAEYARPAPYDPVVGEYYGRAQSRIVMVREYWNILVRQRRIVITTFLAVMTIGMLWTLTRPSLYRASAEMLVATADRGGNTGTLADSVGAVTRVRSILTEVRMMRSPDLLDAAFAALPDEMRLRGFRTKATRMSSYPVIINNSRDTDVITVEVTARDPRAAAEFANQILITNLSRRQETTKNLAELATQHVNAELRKTDAQLKEAWDELANFKRAHGVVDINTQAATHAQGLANLESQATQAEAEMSRAQLTRATLEKELGRTSAVVESSRVAASNPVIQEIDSNIERLQQQRASLLQEYQPTAPEIRSITQQISEATKRKQALINSKSETVTTSRNPIIDTLQQNYINALVAEQEARSRLQATRTSAEGVRRQIAALPGSEQRIALLTSRISELQSSHAYLTNQIQALNVSVRGGLPNVMPFTHARPSNKPISPNIPFSMTIITLLATLLAVGLAILREGLDDHIHTAESLESLAGYRVLASLPHVSDGFRALVSDESCPAALLESFRILRGNLLLAMPDPLPRVIMITSPQAGDGKSTTAANLAATLAMTGKRVLLIDCDLRHPSDHLIHGLSNELGLSSVLSGQVDVRDCIRPTAHGGLFVLVSGPTPYRPPELLGSGAMALLLQSLRDEYDCILLDTTPLVNLSDGLLIAPLTEGVLVVVSSDRTRQPELHDALRSLEQAGAPILGLVYNRSHACEALAWESGGR